MPSSVIARMQYDSVKHTLRVEFVSGAVYDYLNVPETIFNAMDSSGSKGIYLNKNIKAHYLFKKIR